MFSLWYGIYGILRKFFQLAEQFVVDSLYLVASVKLHCVSSQKLMPFLFTYH